MLDTALDNGGPVPVDRHPDRHQVNGTPLIRPTTRPRRSRRPSAGDADHDKSPSMDLVIADGTTGYPLPAVDHPSAQDTAPVAGEATPGAPQLPFDGCGEPKGQEETLCDAS